MDNPLSISPVYSKTKIHSSIWDRFINWCAGQEENKYLWLGLAIMGHGCIITSFTILIIAFAGNNLLYLPFVLIAMVASLVVNIVGLATKITIPIFLLSILIDATIIVLCIAHGFRADNVFNR